MSIKFKRRVKVTVAFDPDDSKGQSKYLKTYRQRVVIESLRVMFQITKTSSKDPNTASVKVYNLSEANRAIFERKPARLILEAGYAGATHTLYSGDIKRAVSRREGADWVTEVWCGTGVFAGNARVAISLPAGTELKTTLEKLAKGMGAALPKNVKEAREFLTGSGSSTGQTIRGPALEEINKLVKAKGYTASIQDGELTIVKSENGVRTVQAARIAQDTGMIGSPEMGTPESEGKPATLTVKTLLQPGITVRGPIVVESRTVNGNFLAQRVDHTGDTHGQQWYTTIEATPF